MNGRSNLSRIPRQGGSKIWVTRLQRGVFAMASLASFAGAAPAAGEGDAGGDASVEVSPPVVPGVFEGDVRDLPTLPEWRPGDPVREGPPRRSTRPEPPVTTPAHPPQGRLESPSGADAGARSATLGTRVFSPPELSFDGQGSSGVVPPDTIGDIGSAHYIQAINSPSGTSVTIYAKTTGAVAAGPFALQSLWTSGGACASGAGDPVVLYDPLASRWLISEFADTGNHLCVYLSRRNDPVAGGWLNYDFPTPEFPDYPKYAVWPDAYYVSSNENDPAAYALDRTRMLAGLPATSQRFVAPALGGFGFQALTPADLDATTSPPGGSPGFFLRHVDDEIHSPATNDPANDFLEVWQLDADFTTPASASFALATTIPVAEFDSSITGLPQPGAAVELDAIREVVMNRLQYRNFGAYQTLVGNFVVDVGGDHGGVRWFELHRTGMGAWSLFQEGTHAPDASHRWLGAIAMDGGGNMALGFSLSSTATFPGMRYTGRLSGDGAGLMTQAEVVAAAGAGSQTDSDRWGDYAAMSVDPIDDCSFWFTSEYVPASGDWKTRIVRFRYDAPTCTDATAPSCGNGVRQVGEDCDGADATYCAGLCTVGCTCPAPTCGNGIAEVGEQCDGASASACPGAACNVDCSCKLCGPTPAVGCRQAEAGRASLRVIDKADDAKDGLTWMFRRGDATLKSELGNPLAAGPRYAVCVYDSSASAQPLTQASVPAGGTCGTKACWKEASKAFRYANRDATPDGITRLVLTAGDDGKSSIQATGKGIDLATLSPPLTLPVTAQVVAWDGAASRCWQTQYTVATKNEAGKFQAKGP